MSRILIVDDDRALCRSLEIQLSAQGHMVKWANTAQEGLAALANGPPDLLLLDLKLPDQSGLDVLRRIRQKYAELPVVMITGHQDMKAAIEAMRGGAVDYLRKPFDVDDLVQMIEKTKARAGRPHVSLESISDEPYEIVGSDRKIVEAVKQIGLLSQSRVSVLIEGETGTGKELVARALHEAGSPGEPFAAINCSAIVPTLLESELFGHEKGAFTGASARKLGKLEFAGHGTVFLDEIGDMSLDLQGKLLRVLEERVFERVGGLQGIPLWARVVAATNRDLESLVAEGKFRRDLFYRLAVARIWLPPLRERRGDIPLLVRHLLTRIARKVHKPITGIEEKAIERLVAYDWPGNVRELQNVLTRAAALARSPIVTLDDLELRFGAFAEPVPPAAEIATLREAEKEHIARALAAKGWNITRTAKLLHISPTTLRKKIADYGLREDS
ncbi:MAG: sigma-54 dependent transcriptional regulator [Candidatus Sumerlaeia bacterium]|nr:sigma-54 dependent transcriptional regulator [Candidatus Sumerlaeia bacterium]